MKISREEIIHIAKLANLNLTDAEIDKYTNDMEDILNFANTVNNVNTDGVDETIGTDTYNVFRKDEVKECTDRQTLLQNAPSQDEGMFRIPKVINQNLKNNWQIWSLNCIRKSCDVPSYDPDFLICLPTTLLNSFSNQYNSSIYINKKF